VNPAKKRVRTVCLKDENVVPPQPISPGGNPRRRSEKSADGRSSAPRVRCAGTRIDGLTIEAVAARAGGVSRPSSLVARAGPALGRRRHARRRDKSFASYETQHDDMSATSSGGAQISADSDDGPAQGHDANIDRRPAWSRGTRCPTARRFSAPVARRRHASGARPKARQGTADSAADAILGGVVDPILYGRNRTRVERAELTLGSSVEGRPGTVTCVPDTSEPDLREISTPKGAVRYYTVTSHRRE